MRRRWLVGELLRGAAGWSAGLLLVLGAAILGVKLFAAHFWPDVLWLGLLALPIAAIVGWQAMRRMPSDRELIAVLDRKLAAGGLLMTLSERPDSTWRHRLPAVEHWKEALPRVRPVRFAKTVAVPALFVVGAGFVPPREAPAPAPQVTAGTDAAKELSETFELLEQADSLDEHTEKTLKRELDQLTSETQDSPLTHEKWETVDALRERLRAGLDATQLSVAQGRSAATALATALAEGQALSVERTEQLSEDLREALETLRKNGALDPKDGRPVSALSSELQQLLKSGDFRLPADAEARQQTLGELKQLLDAEAKRLAEARGRCQQCLGGDGQPGDLFSLSRADSAKQTSGQGGIARGRADATMSYGDESDEQAAKFKEAVLPPGFLDQPNDTVQGVTASAPPVEPAGDAQRNAARESAPATGKTTWDRPLRPRHREIVREYFGGRAP
ncbi:MAG: hypothetical protein WBC44_20205 [Planctomycetaceae bacterium]